MAQKILIIEDDKILAETLHSILADSGLFEIAVANDGGTGMKLADEFKPDMIILDLLMSGSTGMDLLLKWHESGYTNTVPITVATNLDNLQIMNRAMQLGARNYFLKSEMSPEAIIENCKNVLAGNYTQPAQPDEAPPQAPAS